MEIIFEDKDIIVINKPAGVAVQSASVIQKDCVTLLKEYFRNSNPSIKGEPYVGVVHRLDQPVAGLLVFAKNQNAAAKLSKQVGAGVGMNKIYTAIVQGIVPSGNDVELKNYVIKDSKEKRAIIMNSMDEKKVLQKDKPKKAVLTYSVVSTDTMRNVSTLKVVLKTGRFHQIRAQLSNLGYPIVGDKKYGAIMEYDGGNSNVRGAIALQACELSFTHPSSGKIMCFTL